MASEAARRAAGADGIGAPGEPEAEQTKKGRGKKGKDAVQQSEALKAPEVLKFKAPRGELRVPTDFTIGDIVQKRVTTDLSAFVFLVVAETNRIAGTANVDMPPALLFAPRMQGFFTAALRTSNVVEFLNGRLLMAVGQLFDDKGERIPLTMADLEALEDVPEGAYMVEASLKIGIHFVARWVEAHRKNR